MHGAGFELRRREAVGQVDLPALFEGVDVHDDLGFAGGELDGLAKTDCAGADRVQADRAVREHEVEPHAGRMAKAGGIRIHGKLAG